MSFSHVCPKCHSTMTVPERYTGRQLKCTTCGTPFSVDKPDTAAPAAADTAAGQAAVKPEHRSRDGVGLFLLIVPAAAIVLMWAWIGQMNLLQGPGSALALVIAVTVIATAALAGHEASTLGMGRPGNVDKRGRSREGPVAWFFLVLLLWALCYPMYMYRRHRYGVHNHLLIAALLVVGCVGSALALSNAITQRSTEVVNVLKRTAPAARLTQDSAEQIDAHLLAVRVRDDEPHAAAGHEVMTATYERALEAETAQPSHELGPRDRSEAGHTA
jgi:hypothetical protein